jgi:hypothetical protein
MSVILPCSLLVEAAGEKFNTKRNSDSSRLQSAAPGSMA